MKNITYGRIRMRIMQALWDKKKVSAQDITNLINACETVAHSTVQTHLRALEEQGAVDHDVEDRTFMYYALVQQDSLMKSKTKDFIDLLFAGSGESLLLYLVDNSYIGKDEIKKVTKLFDGREK